MMSDVREKEDQDYGSKKLFIPEDNCSNRKKYIIEMKYHFHINEICYFLY